MKNSTDYHYLLAKLAMIFIFCSSIANAQNSNLVEYEYIFPVPYSTQLPPEENIIIRQGAIIDESTSHLECSYSDEKELENHIMFVGKIIGDNNGEL